MKKKRRPGAGDARPKKGGIRRPLSEITESEQARILAVYSGQKCLGFLLLRGKLGVEAYNISDISLGIFPDQKSAADAISTKAAS